MQKKTQHFDSRQEMKRSDYEIFHYNEPLKNEVGIHNHDFYEIFFLIDGDISYWLEGETYHLRKGDILFIDPVTLHRPIIPDDNPAYERIVLWIGKNYLDSVSSDEIELSDCFKDSFSYLLHPTSPQRVELTEKFGELVHEYYSEEYGADLYAQGLFLQIMVILNRMKKETFRQLPSKNTSTLVSKAVEYIGEHFSEELSLDILAEKFFVSKYHLSHEFTHNVGTSVHRYITLKRLTAAKRMLMDDFSPGEVYTACGFRDYTSFFRSFKAEYGISPRDFSSRI